MDTLNKIWIKGRLKMSNNNFDNHISELERSIKEYEECIKFDQQELENLRIELEKVKEEKKQFSEFEYEPSLPKNIEFKDFTKENNDLLQKAYKVVRDHELFYHKELIGNYIPNDSFHFINKIPRYEFVSSNSRYGLLKHIVCIDCFKRSIKENDDSIEYSYDLERV